MIDVVMIELLRTTGAARRFLAERVEPAVVHQILDDARFAPSGGNRQPWKVAVVEDRALRRQIGDADAAACGTTTRPPAPASRRTTSSTTSCRRHAARRRTSSSTSIDRDPRRARRRRRPPPDRAHGRATSTASPVTGGASIYPFCWSILLSARARGLGGVMTTFLSRRRARRRPAARPPRAPCPRRDDLPRRPRARHARS